VNIFLPDVVGFIGVSLVVYAYYLIQTEKVTVKDTKYSMFNIVGSLLIIVSLFFNFNISSFLIEAFWVLISIFGIYRSRKPRA
jgi:hypothetical protein